MNLSNFDRRSVSPDRILRVLLPLVLMLFMFCVSRSVEVQGIGADTDRIFVRAKITQILHDTTDRQANQGTQSVQAVIIQGRFRGQTCELQNANTYQRGALCSVGTKIIASISVCEDGSIQGSVYNYDRTEMLYLLLSLFAVVLLAVGRKKGAASLYALLFTVVTIGCLYIPMMYHGMDPIVSAVLSAIVILVASNYIFNGWSIKTWCAILGTTVGVLLSGVLAWGFGTWFHLNGYHMADGEGMIYIANHSLLSVGNVLFGGILISSLGAVMDVSVSIVSALYELKTKAPQLSFAELFRSGMNIGHDMMATMSNTLILAYAGSATSGLLTVYAYQMPYLQVMGYNSIVIEVLCGLAGTIGVVLTVPLQTLITSAVLKMRLKSMTSSRMSERTKR